MSKMLLTQLNGVFQKILQNEDMLEETARLLAQATVGQGKIYIACFGKMKPIELLAISEQQFSNLVIWDEHVKVESVDRVWIFTDDNHLALKLAEQLYEQFIPFAVIAPEKESDSNKLSELAYTYISMNIRGGILPHPTKPGERIVKPYTMAGLFIYEAVKLYYIEMLEDYE